MCKKRIVFIVIALSIISGIILYQCLAQKVNITAGTAILEYHYESVNITQKLSSDEYALVKSTVNNKRLYNDNPSCGFSSDVSIKFGDLTLCMACDSCAIMNLNNTDKFITISKEQRKKLEEIFNKYGGTFPCL